MSVGRCPLPPVVMLAAALLASCAAEPTYPACVTKPRNEDVEAAKGAHSAAVRLFDKRDYERSIELWRVAYELDCSAHLLLINIARAYENLGDEEAARQAYELYVERAGRDADPAIVARLAGSAAPSATAAGQAARKPSKPPNGRPSERGGS